MTELSEVLNEAATRITSILALGVAAGTVDEGTAVAVGDAMKDASEAFNRALEARPTVPDEKWALAAFEALLDMGRMINEATQRRCDRTLSRAEIRRRAGDAYVRLANLHYRAVDGERE